MRFMDMRRLCALTYIRPHDGKFSIAYTPQSAMTAKELAKMRRLEIEVATLRESISNHLRVYADQALELVDLKIKIEQIKLALQPYDE